MAIEGHRIWEESSRTLSGLVLASVLSCLYERALSLSHFCRLVPLPLGNQIVEEVRS
jgi:hypothetical protein